MKKPFKRGWLIRVGVGLPKGIAIGGNRAREKRREHIETEIEDHGFGGRIGREIGEGMGGRGDVASPIGDSNLRGIHKKLPLDCVDDARDWKSRDQGEQQQEARIWLLL